MTFLIVFLVLICMYELPGLIKQNQKKEIFMFLGLTLAAFVAGYIYISNPLVDKSIIRVMMEAIGIW